jgi:hypothetical protein
VRRSTWSERASWAARDEDDDDDDDDDDWCYL